jgi:predicted esterase
MIRITRLSLYVIIILLSFHPSTSLLAQEDSDLQSPPQQQADTNEILLWHEAPALFPVVVKLPEDFDSTRVYPALVALHGFGSSSKAFSRIAPVFTRSGFIVILPEAPYSVPSDKPGDHISWGLNTWTPPPLTNDPAIDTRSVELMVFEHIPAAIKRVEEEYKVGAKYIFGFSQGAIYAFVSGFYNRDIFDGIIAFGLSGMPSIRDWLAQRGDSIKDGNSLPVLLVNGTEDKLAPYTEAEIALKLLKQEGYDVTLLSFLGGHAVRDEELEKAAQWLNQKLTTRRSNGSKNEEKITDEVMVSGVFSPDGPPSAPPRRIDAGTSCIVDLKQDYTVTGTLSGTFKIDYRINVDGPCGSPMGTFDEDWIAHGTFSGIVNGNKISTSFTYLAHVQAGGKVKGKMVFGHELSGELAVSGSFSDGELSYHGLLTR